MGLSWIVRNVVAIHDILSVRCQPEEGFSLKKKKKKVSERKRKAESYVIPVALTRL